jgi:hypothetical protein
MIEHARHVPLRPIRWSEGDVTAAIEDIVADALEHFDAERFWPRTPSTKEFVTATPACIFGATGVIWGIDYLGRVGATKTRFGFRPVPPRLLEASQASSPNGNTRRMGCCLATLGRRSWSCEIDPTPAIVDLVYARADAYTILPVRELMWGIPGSMIVCCQMAAMTAEPRWRALLKLGINLPITKK